MNHASNLGTPGASEGEGFKSCHLLSQEKNVFLSFICSFELKLMGILRCAFCGVSYFVKGRSVICKI